MTRLLVVLIIIAFIGCQSDSTESKQKVEDTPLSEFEVYLNSLDTIPLPFEYRSTDELPDMSVNYDTILYSRYKSSPGSKPYGILFRTPSYSIVIDCFRGTRSCLPNIISYDSTGNRIDSIPEITQRFGIYFDNQINDEFIRIDKNRKITLLDEGPLLIEHDGNERPIDLEPNIDTIVYDVLWNGKFDRNNRESNFIPVD